MFKIDERVGCIAVVESSFTGNCLYAEMDGVVAFWSGVRSDDGWEVLEWQKEKASQLCNLLNGQAAEQNAHLTLGSRPGFCVCCGGEVTHPVCIDCLPSPAQVA